MLNVSQNSLATAYEFSQDAKIQFFTVMAAGIVDTQYAKYTEVVLSRTCVYYED